MMEAEQAKYEAALPKFDDSTQMRLVPKNITADIF